MASLAVIGRPRLRVLMVGGVTAAAPVCCRRGSDASRPAHRHSFPTINQPSRGEACWEFSGRGVADSSKRQTERANGGDGCERTSGWWIEGERERLVTGTRCQMASVNNHPLFFTSRDKHTLHSHHGFFLCVFKEALPRSDACSREPFGKEKKKMPAWMRGEGGRREIKPGLCN